MALMNLAKNQLNVILKLIGIQFLNAKRGNFDNIPSDIKVRCYSNLKKIEKDHLVCSDSSELRGVWIYGPAGSGKSRLAREQYLTLISS